MHKYSRSGLGFSTKTLLIQLYMTLSLVYGV